eukprot:Hpha_TRINITY_DN16202_c2_g1::TRINITY_DN16202_c2_g1_i5::g.11313::m.11313
MSVRRGEVDESADHAVRIQLPCPALHQRLERCQSPRTVTVLAALKSMDQPSDFASWLLGSQYGKGAGQDPTVNPPPSQSSSPRGDGVDGDRLKQLERLEKRIQALRDLRSRPQRVRRCPLVELRKTGLRRRNRDGQSPRDSPRNVAEGRDTSPQEQQRSQVARVPHPPQSRRDPLSAPVCSSQFNVLKAAIVAQTQLSEYTTLFPPLMTPYEHHNNFYRGWGPELRQYYDQRSNRRVPEGANVFLSTGGDPLGPQVTMSPRVFHAQPPKKRAPEGKAPQRRTTVRGSGIGNDLLEITSSSAEALPRLPGAEAPAAGSAGPAGGRAGAAGSPK